MPLPVTLVSHAPASALVMPWWRAEHRQLSIIVKATFEIAPGGALRPGPVAPVVAKDQHFERSPGRSVEVPGDLLPYKPRTDVFLVGHAHAPAGRTLQAASVRLAIYGPRGGAGPALLDRTLHVIGDRSMKTSRSPQPFSKMPLVWERAVGGAGTDNPVGRPLASPELPNLIDPAEEGRPACFAPLSAYWPPVRNRLPAGLRRDVDASEPRLPEPFDWEYYQRAPEELRAPHLRGDEWVVLDGLHPTATRLAFRLPGARAAGVVDTAAGRAALSFVLDTLLVDTDRLLVTQVFRAVLAAEGAYAEDRIQLSAGVEVPPGKLVFPEAAPMSARAPMSSPAPLSAGPPSRARTAMGMGPAPLPPAAPPPDLGRTQLGDEAPASRALPFSKAEDLGSTRLAPDEELTAPVLPFHSTGPAAPAPPPSSTPFVAPPASMVPVASPPPASMPFVAPPPASMVPVASPPPASMPFVRAPAAPPPAAAPPPVATPPPAAAPPAAPPSAPMSVAAALFAGVDADDEHTMMVGALPDWGRAPALPFDPNAPVHLPPTPERPPASEGDDDDEGQTIIGRVGSVADLPFEVAEARPAEVPEKRAKDEAHAENRIRPAGAPMLPVFSEGPLAVATLAWQVKPRQDSLTVVVKGTFELVAGEAARPAEPEIPTGDIPASEAPNASLLHGSDFAVMKPMADVVLTGHAYPPRSGGARDGRQAPSEGPQKPARGAAAQVTFRFGERGKGFERRVAVLGDRRWQKGVVTSAGAPDLFERMPLVYERAWGGPEVDSNPSGVGFRAREGEDGLARMPNLEDPDRLVSSPTAQVEPACFAPIAPTWKERWSKLGTYDSRWLATRWPYFPDDFDWAHFQVAPRAQRLPHLTGDEPYSIAGADPEIPLLEGKLPGLRTRAFAVKRGGKELTEVRLALDTAAFDMDQRKVKLTWRGLIDVTDPEAPELEAVFAFTEPLAGPRASREEALSKYLAHTAPKEVPELPATKPANDPPEPAVPDPEVEQMVRDIEEREKAILASLAASGLGGEAPPARKGGAEVLEEALRSSGASEEDIVAMRAAFAPEAPLPPEAFPHRDPRKVVKEKLAAGEPLDRENLRGADLQGLSLDGASLALADLREADLRGCSLKGAKLAGASLMGAKLDDASLEGADLSLANLLGASLARTVLRGALLKEASFLRAHAEGADLSGATGALCRMTEAVLTGASFAGADLPSLDLTKATIDGASFEGAKLADVKLYEAKGSRADFRKAEMPGARAEGADLNGALFTDVSAERSVFEAAILDGASFERAKMKESSFARAKLRKTLFGKADLREGRFRRADVRGASFVLANLTMATFERADLTLADLRGACLHDAETWHATLDHSKLDQAIVTQTKLARRG